MVIINVNKHKRIEKQWDNKKVEKFFLFITDRFFGSSEILLIFIKIVGPKSFNPELFKLILPKFIQSTMEPL